jgi:hypothetical protein
MVSRAAAYAALVLLWSSGEAHAIRLHYTNGDRYTIIKPLPPNAPVLSQDPGAGPKPIFVGYKHTWVAVSDLPFWTTASGGEYVAFAPQGDGVWYTPLGTNVDLVSEATGVPAHELRIPWKVHHPIGLYFLVGVISFYVISWLRPKRKLDGPVGDLERDPRYQQALDAVDRRFSWFEPGQPPRHQVAFDAGVELLERLGVPREEAATNLTLLLEARAARQAG